MTPATVHHHNDAQPEFWTVERPGAAVLLFADFGRLLDTCRDLGLDPVPTQGGN